MTLTIQFTRAAEQDLRDIFLWSFEQFGPLQAEKYLDDIIERCNQLASGTLPSRSCRDFITPEEGRDYRYFSTGSHFIIFAATQTACQILAVEHQSTNLPARIAALSS